MSRSPIYTIKRFFLVASFFSLFFLQPAVIFAQSESNSDKPKDFWSSIWDAIAGLFGIVRETDEYLAKKYEPSISDGDSGFTNFNKRDKDVATRATTDSANAYNKGIYLNNVLNNQFGYENKHLAYGCDNACSYYKSKDSCVDIDIKNLIYYFYSKNTKILYQSGSAIPIEYDPSKFGSQTLVSDDTCYQTLYNTLSYVPQGKFQGKADTAAGSSTQLNNALRTAVPFNQQGEDAPQDISSTENVEKIIKDNDKQENTMLNNFIPESANSSPLAFLYRSQLLAQNYNPSDVNNSTDIIPNATCSVSDKVILDGQCDSENANIPIRPGASTTVCDAGCGGVATSEILQGQSSIYTPKYLFTNQYITTLNGQEVLNPYYNKSGSDGGIEITWSRELIEKVMGKDKLTPANTNAQGEWVSEKSCSVNDIKNLICDGNAVIMNIHWDGGGHYITAVAADNNNNLWIKDPGTGKLEVWPSTQYENKNINFCVGVKVKSNGNASYIEAANTRLSKDKRREIFADYLHPYAWQDDEDAPLRDDLPDDAGGEYSGTCNAVSSHCRGMSQYGALGMSQSSFPYQSILKFYYGNVEFVPISSIQKPDGTLIGANPEVKIDFVESDDCGGGSTLDLEDYLSGLGEMPDYWGNSSKGGFEALKAQVIAARTYAMMKTGYFNRKICNSSRCQVFRCQNLRQRPNLNRAIEATRGLVMVDAVTKKPFSSEYARSFCGPSRQVVYKNVHTNPSVNGIEYERKARNGQEPFCK